MVLEGDICILPE
ncbi:hypothetical protein F383_05999 [Gossypium arboreum]|uniref:Uncharacterized protein n=1 Tax=Gossypium arboreum TaxID=29729 RepID=A0A0B0PHD7_GOSAR|nr:hypothetical protein F383_05999 [Gossypium arboreum]